MEEVKQPPMIGEVLEDPTKKYASDTSFDAQLDKRSRYLSEQYPEGVVTERVVFDYLRAKRQDAACEICTGAPCKKERNPGYKHIVVKNFLGELEVVSVECPFARKERFDRRIARQFAAAQVPKKYQIIQ